MLYFLFLGLQAYRKVAATAHDSGPPICLPRAPEGTKLGIGCARRVPSARPFSYLLMMVIPGTYESGKPIITIQSFMPKLTVIPSKQRPRRLALKGSDGRDYQYLLKGMSTIAPLFQLNNLRPQVTRICDRTSVSCSYSVS